jgi:hypothetical protein
MVVAGLALWAQDTVRRVVPADAMHRIALVVGNNAYTRTPLANSVNDSRGVASALRSAGFDVRTLENADTRQLDLGVQSFVSAVQPGDVALFYYSGHGMQMAGENYLVPVNFEATTETDAKYQAFPLGKVTDSLQERGARLKIVILDACRDNPFSTSRSSSHGLAAVVSGRGSFIAYATDPGKTADDNPSGGYGMFTKHLIVALQTPGLALEQVFAQARAGVERDSNGRQIPWTSSSVIGEFYFLPPSAAAAPSPGSPSSQEMELAYWNSIKDSRNPAMFRAYLNRFPNGTFKELAEIQLKNVEPPAGNTKAEVPTSQTAPALNSVAAPGVKQYTVVHWHNSSTSVSGGLSIGNGTVRFEEAGAGEHSFAATCKDIRDITTAPAPSNAPEDSSRRKVGKKKKMQADPVVSFQPAGPSLRLTLYESIYLSSEQSDEIAGSIRVMCGLNRGLVSGKKKGQH